MTAPTAPTKKLTKILVANRGEIAVRVIRTAHEMGISTVVGYADSDIDSLACRLTDEAYALGGELSADSYMNIGKLIDVAQRSGADAIHPGYGFLSESAEFARAVTDAGLTWIGPSAHSINVLGDKMSARRIATNAGVGVIPGRMEPLTSADQVAAFGSEVGYPIIGKRADLGGGRGITRLDDEAAARAWFATSIAGAGDEVQRLTFLEKLVQGARHVETQCVRDIHGNFHVVSTRDCSMQRRNQKVIEEAPAPCLPPGVADTLAD